MTAPLRFYRLPGARVRWFMQVRTGRTSWLDTAVRYAWRNLPRELVRRDR